MAAAMITVRFPFATYSKAGLRNIKSLPQGGLFLCFPFSSAQKYLVGLFPVAELPQSRVIGGGAVLGFWAELSLKTELFLNYLVWFSSNMRATLPSIQLL